MALGDFLNLTAGDSSRNDEAYKIAGNSNVLAKCTGDDTSTSHREIYLYNRITGASIKNSRNSQHAYFSLGSGSNNAQAWPFVNSGWFPVFGDDISPSGLYMNETHIYALLSVDRADLKDANEARTSVLNSLQRIYVFRLPVSIATPESATTHNLGNVSRINTQTIQLPMESTKGEGYRYTGIWADDETMFVLGFNRKGTDSKIFAFNLSNGLEDTSKSFTISRAVNTDVRVTNGLFGDLTHLYTVTGLEGTTTDTTFTFRILAFNRSTGLRNKSLEFDVTSSTLGLRSLRGLHGDALTTPHRLWLSYKTIARAHSFSIVATPDPPTTPTKLTGVSGAKQATLSWEASSTADDYELRYRIGTGSYTTVTDITATGYLVTGLTGGSTYKFSVRAGNSGGFSAWSTEIDVSVASGFGDRVPNKDISQTKLRAAVATIDPYGIWSDNTTMWVSGFHSDAIWAFVLATGARDSSKDISQTKLRAARGSISPVGIWSDGTTMWVVDANNDAIWAFVLATGARDSSKDISQTKLRVVGSNVSPIGIWSDGTTMWVADRNDAIWAFVLATGARDSSKDITQANLRAAANPIDPHGIWSDGTTMWVSDPANDAIWAFVLATGARDSSKDVTQAQLRAATGSIQPSSIWSDGTTMWVADRSNDAIWAFSIAQGPPLPTGLAGTSTSTTITATWDAVDGATAYDVRYRIGSGAYTTEEDVAGTRHAFSGLTANTAYKISIRSKSASGNSDWSAEVTVTTAVAAVTKPAVPSAIAAAAGDGEVILTWAAAARAADYDIRYRVGNGAYTTITGVTGTRRVITGLTNGTTYSFSIRASNTIGDSNYTTAVTATPVAGATGTRPDTPLNLETVAGDGEVTVFWDDSDGATHYDLRYRIGVGAYTEITNINATQRVVTGLTNNTEYQFSVRAGNDVGSSAYTNEVKATPAVAAQKPATPTNIVATAGDGRVTVTWTPVTGASSYTILLRGSGTAPRFIRNISGNRRVITGLNNGTTYTVNVQAVNPRGSSDYAASVSFTPMQADPPPVPTGLAGTGGNARVTLTWTAVDEADTYDISYVRSSGGSATVLTEITGTQYIVTGLTNGTDYKFKIRSVNDDGSSNYSSEITVRPIAPPKPAVPSNLKATPGDKRVTLSWDLVSAATKYDIEYKRSSVSNWTSIQDVNRTGRVITGLTNGITYQFRVRSKNDNGVSAYTTAVTATPVAPVTPKNPPEVPSVLIGIPGDEHVSLGWAAEAEADDYDVRYRKGSSGAYTTVTGLLVTSHLVDNLDNGSVYEFQVRAENADGRSDWTPATKATPNPTDDDMVLNPPTVVVAVPASKEVRLLWSVEHSASVYEVEYRTGSGSWTSIDNLTSTTTLITGLIDGTTYEFRVRSKASTTSDWSESIFSTPIKEVDSGAPQPPDTVITIVTNQEVLLTWGHSLNSDEYDIRYRKGSDAWVLIENINLNHRTVGPLENGTTYEFQVRGKNTSVKSAWSESVFDTPVDFFANVLEPPSILVGVPMDTSVALTWGTSRNAEKYDLRYKFRNDPFTVVSDISGLTHTVTGLTLGRTYQFEVRATSAGGGTTTTEEIVTAQWEKFSRGTVVTTNPTAAIDARCVAGNQDTAYSSPDPWSLDDFQISDSDFIIRTTLRLKDDNRWRNIRIKADASGADDAVLYSLQKTDGTEIRRIAIHNMGTAQDRTASTFSTAGVVSAYDAANADGDYEFNLVIYYVGKTSPAGLVNLSLGYMKEDGTLVDPVVLISDFDKQVTEEITRSTSKVSRWSQTPIWVTLPNPDSVPLVPPDTLVAVPGTNSIRLSWNAVPNAVSYDIGYGEGDGTFVRREDIINTNFNIINLSPGTTYSLRARSKDANKESDWSSVIFSTTETPIVTPLVAPDTVVPVVGDRAIQVTWNDVPGATSYELNYQSSGGGWLSRTTTDTTFTIINISNGITYAIRVRAKDATRTSPWSETTHAVPYDPLVNLPPPVIPPPQAPPPIPGTLKLVPDTNSISLTWQEAPRAASYDIRFRESDESEWHTVTDVDREAYIITGLLHNVAYDVAVRAINVFGASLWTEPVKATTKVLVAPETPENFMATVGDTQIILSWDISELATTYVVTGQLSDESEDAFTIDDLTDFDTPYTVGRLKNGKAYKFTIIAENSAGESDPSAEITATPTASVTAFDVLTGLSASPLDKGVQLYWYNPNPESGVDIDYALSSSNTWTTLTLTNTYSPHTISGLMNGMLYKFRIRSNNGAGVTSDWSEITVATPGVSVIPIFVFREKVLILKFENDSRGFCSDDAVITLGNESQYGNFKSLSYDPWIQVSSDFGAELLGEGTAYPRLQFLIPKDSINAWIAKRVIGESVEAAYIERDSSSSAWRLSNYGYSGLLERMEVQGQSILVYMLPSIERVIKVDARLWSDQAHQSEYPGDLWFQDLSTISSRGRYVKFP